MTEQVIEAEPLRGIRKWFKAENVLFFLVFLIPFQQRFYKFLQKLSLSLVNPHWHVPQYFEIHLDAFISDFVLLALIFGCLKKGMIQWRSFFWEGERKYLSLFLFFSLVSILNSDFATYPLPYWRWLHLALPAFLFFFLSRTAVNFRKLAQIVLIIALIECAIAIPQYFIQHSLGLKGLGEPTLIARHFVGASFPMIDGAVWIFDRLFHVVREHAFVLRASGTLPHPNVLGGFMVFSLLMTYHLYGEAKKRGWLIPKEHEKSAFRAARKSPRLDDCTARSIKPIQLAVQSSNPGVLARSKSRFFIFLGYSLAILLQTFCLFITYSRASLYAAGFTTIMWIALTSWREKKIHSLFWVCSASFLICLGLLYPQLFERGGIVSYNSVVQGSDALRLTVQDVGLAMLRAHPILGIGFNNYMLAFQNFAQGQALPATYIHNIYLHLAVEVGVLGLLSFLVFCLLLLIKGWKNRQQPEVLTSGCIFLGILAIGLVDFYPLCVQQMRLILFLVAGLLINRDSQKSVGYRAI